MSSDFLKTLINWPRPYLSGTDLCAMLDRSSDARQAVIKRAVQKGVLEPVRRDLYLIKIAKTLAVNAFELVPVIYGPSYLSLESALSYHGWIPEAVRTITCASVKRAKEFDTPLGLFSYVHVPTEAFFCGVEQHLSNGLTLFIATPMRAIADIIYARKRTWATANALFEDLRIEKESFKYSDFGVLKELIATYPSPRVRRALYRVQQGMHL